MTDAMPIKSRQRLRAIAIAIALICMVPACTVTKVDQEARAISSEPNLLGQPGFSRLSTSGVKQIKDSRSARFDFRDLTLTNAEAGLPADYNRDVIIGGAGKPDIELTFLGPEAQATVSTQTIWITTYFRGGRFEDLIFWRSFDTTEGAQHELAQATARWGILPENVDTWTHIASKADDGKEKWSLGSGIGPTGLIIDMNASIKNGVQVFQYYVHLNPLTYNPENIESIRTTGISHRPVS